MDKFIYVFDVSARDKLLAAGFSLLKADDKNEMYVFNASSNLNFKLSSADISYLTSNTLTF